MGGLWGKLAKADVRNKTEMKKIIAREKKRRLKLVLKSKLNGKNKVITINTSECQCLGIEQVL